MPVLLLARGDTQAKDLLRHAIEARYGFRPPALETLQVALVGRIHARMGLLATWLPIEMTGRLRFPYCIHWAYTVRPAGVPVKRGAEAFDGRAYRRHDGSAPQANSDTALIGSVQKRLWAFSAALLTPLTEQHVELRSTGEHSLEAVHRETGDTAQLTLGADKALQSVQVTAYNPNTGKDARFTVALSPTTITLNEMIFPAMLTASWNDVPYLELQPTAAESNPALDERVFALAR